MKKTVILLAMLGLVLSSCSKLERNEKKYLDGILSEDYATSNQAMAEFNKWMTADEATMTYDFNLMREKLGMKIVDSPGGKLRCYSWITSRGDTICNYANIVQMIVNGQMVGYAGPLEVMLTGRKPAVGRQWSLSHSIDTIYQLEAKPQPIYLIEQSYVNETGLSFSYLSAAAPNGVLLKILPFFFNGIETAGNRGYVDDGKVNKKDLIKWDAKEGKLYSYMTDDQNHVIPGKYETYVLGVNQFTKVDEPQNDNNKTENINN